MLQAHQCSEATSSSPEVCHPSPLGASSTRSRFFERRTVKHLGNAMGLCGTQIFVLENLAKEVFGWECARRLVKRIRPPESYPSQGSLLRRPVLRTNLSRV